MSIDEARILLASSMGIVGSKPVRDNPNINTLRCFHAKYVGFALRVRLSLRHRAHKHPISNSTPILIFFEVQDYLRFYRIQSIYD